jgi:hypothetical protein
MCLCTFEVATPATSKPFQEQGPMRTIISKPEIAFRGRSLESLIVPIVNLNGNSQDSLARVALGVAMAMEQMMSTLAEATGELGHGRNFQTIKDGDQEAALARTILRQRMEVISAMQHEFQQLALKVQEQGR